MCKIVKFMHAFRLDVAWGAVCMSFYVHYSLGVTIQHLWMWLLGTGVLLVYHLDYCLDVCMGKTVPNNTSLPKCKRLNLHMAIPLLCGSILIQGVTFLVNFEDNVRLLGVGVGILLTAYFLLHFRQALRGKPRFWMVSVLYTLGVGLPVWGHWLCHFTPNDLCIALLVLMAAISNLYVFDVFNRPLAEPCDAQIITRAKLQVLVFNGVSLVCCIGLHVLASFMLVHWMFVAIGWFYMFMLHNIPYFSFEQRFRIYADGVLALPGTILMCKYVFCFI